MLNEQCVINGKEVDLNSLEIEDVDTSDYPDFCDAFVAYGEFIDGTEMTEEECNEFRDEYGYIVNEKAHESLH